MTDTPLTTLSTHAATPLAVAPSEIGSMFSSIQAFEAGQRMALALAKCELLPKQYQNNPANCLVLLSVAHRFRHMGVDPFMVAQQLVPVNGKYGWQGQFVIAVVNGSQRFAHPLRFGFDGDGDDYGCTAYATWHDGTDIKGSKITWRMVKAEGWSQKSGSKWQTMPEQMFKYRAAAFFGREHCPDLLMGFQSFDELEDSKDITPLGSTKGMQLTQMLVAEAAQDLSAAAPPPRDLGKLPENDLWADLAAAEKERSNIPT